MFKRIQVGMRVYHSRYSWLVGKVAHVTSDGYATVVYRKGLIEITQTESVSDLRMTPVQP